MTRKQQLAKLLHGYGYGSDENDNPEGKIEVRKSWTYDDLLRVAAKHGIRVYEPGDFHGRDSVVIADECYAYAVENGEVRTIAG